MGDKSPKNTAKTKQQKNDHKKPAPSSAAAATATPKK